MTTTRKTFLIIDPQSKEYYIARRSEDQLLPGCVFDGLDTMEIGSVRPEIAKTGYLIERES